MSMIKTKAIVLQSLKYSEKNVIVKTYTERKGLVSFFMYQSKGKNNKTQKNILHPLSLVEIIYHEKENKQMQNLREIQRSIPLQSIGLHPLKNIFAMFFSEIISKAIQEQENNMKLYGFLENSVLTLDRAQENINNFPPYFLLSFSKYLGFYPKEREHQQEIIFDLREGTFMAYKPKHKDYLDATESSRLYTFLNKNWQQAQQIPTTQNVRNCLNENILMYYQVHLPGTFSIKSYRILREVLHA